jgi:hypothetical protein
MEVILMAEASLAQAPSPAADSLTDRGAEVGQYWEYRGSSSTPGTLAAARMTDRDFVTEFQLRPSMAVETLLVFADLGLVSKRDATQWVFPLLIQARGETRRQLYQALLTLGEPKAILDVALSAYEKYGNEDRLTLAASLLMDLGAHALPSLRILARSNRPECAWFVATIAGLPDVELQNRVEVLIYLVRSPHSAVRQSLLGATQALPSPEAISLLHMLSQDPDEEIAEEAQECLANFEA